MTVYKGKGLEFDNVVVLSASDGNYPFFKVNKILNASWSSDKDRKQALIDRKEDARKFYVAISRAKKRLCVSFTETNANGYQTRCTPFMDKIKHFFTFGKA
jgi:DNA helicase-2/ATP-dependent DNA helicase PcrA